MLTLQPVSAPATVHEPVKDLRQKLAAINAEFRAENLPVNCDGIWRVLLAPDQKLTGDLLIMAAGLASLEKHSGQGVRVFKWQLAQRCTTIKRLLMLASEFGWTAIHNALSTEGDR